jgi:hypothetical protein
VVPEKKLSRNVETLEKAMFLQSVQLFFSRKSGELVLEDELLGSHAKDGKIRTLSTKDRNKRTSI